jgi:tetratricopeptide (TPR) repeat protein
MRGIWVCVAFVVLGALSGCDHIETLKQDLLGSAVPEEQESAEILGAKALYETGQIGDAIERFEQITSADPTSEKAFYYLGLCYLDAAGESAVPGAPLTAVEQKSRDAFLRALALDPRLVEASVGMGDLYSRRLGRRPRRNPKLDPSEDPFLIALEAYERAVTINPNLPDSQLHYARFLERALRTKEAEEAYKAAVKAAAPIPEAAPDSYLAYGRFLAGRTGRIQEAISQYELARMFRRDDLEIQREIAIAHGRMGQEYFDNEKFSLAEQSLNMSYGMFPDKNDAEAQKVLETLEELRSIRAR